MAFHQNRTSGRKKSPHWLLMGSLTLVLCAGTGRTGLAQICPGQGGGQVAPGAGAGFDSNPAGGGGRTGFNPLATLQMVNQAQRLMRLQQARTQRQSFAQQPRMRFAAQRPSRPARHARLANRLQGDEAAQASIGGPCGAAPGECAGLGRPEPADRQRATSLQQGRRVPQPSARETRRQRLAERRARHRARVEEHRRQLEERRQQPRQLVSSEN